MSQNLRRDSQGADGGNNGGSLLIHIDLHVPVTLDLGPKRGVEEANLGPYDKSTLSSDYQILLKKSPKFAKTHNQEHEATNRRSKQIKKFNMKDLKCEI